MVKVWFPNIYMRLMSVNTSKTPAQAVFHVPPKMTKFDIKEYLSKIYDIPVLKVSTAIFLGKWKRLYGKRKVISYKRRNVKKAFVDFEHSGKPL
mmetsp:Transcript_19719/g.19826  ORF Transcript_19719/g.19826 Transcript_19719/m.19826 type:complete len:94 (-) Transcript_19719:234-515(-)